jgi:Uma2 family endonuclease
MIQTPTKQITLEEFLTLPETKPASEYINGEIAPKPMPQGKHSKLQAKLVTAINQAVETQEIAQAFPELRCTFAGRSLIPDVSIFAWNRIPLDENGDIANGFAISPDWAIEILSPDQNQTRVTDNLLHCLNHGCSIGWLIDPEERSVLIYPAGQQPQLFREEGSALLLVPTLFQGFQLTANELFGWLKLKHL